MPKNEPGLRLQGASGLNNILRPARLPDGWLVDADNVNIDDTGGIARRAGYVAVSGLSAIRSAYATRDGSRLYVVVGSELRRIRRVSPLVADVVRGDIPAGDLWWAESGSYVFHSGAKQGIIYESTATDFADWGGDSDSVVVQDVTLPVDDDDIAALPGIPQGECIAYANGSVWLSIPDPANDMSVVVWSRPFRWNRFDLHTDNIPIPGRVNLLTDANGTIIIGTDREIYLYADNVLTRVANYGTVPGGAVTHDESGNAYFWTVEGLCAAAPFKNLMDDRYSPIPGDHAAVCIVDDGDGERILVSVRGGGTARSAY